MIVYEKDGFIKNEFSHLRLGDQRLNKRLIKIVEKLDKNPSLSIPEIAEGNPHEIKAIYRFFQNPKIDSNALLETHYKNTIERCNEYKGKVLLISDSTFVSPQKKIEGLKPKGKGAEHCLRVHYTLAVSEDKKHIFGMVDYLISGGFNSPKLAS